MGTSDFYERRDTPMSMIDSGNVWIVRPYYWLAQENSEELFH